MEKQVALALLIRAAQSLQGASDRLAGGDDIFANAASEQSQKLLDFVCESLMPEDSE